MSMTFATDVIIQNGQTIQTNKVLAPTSSGGSTYGAGSSGQVLTSNGTGSYWATAGGSTVSSGTLAAGSWTSATPPTQTISVTGVTASNNIIVSIASTATSAQYAAAAAGQLLCTAQGAGEITVTCYGTEPTENIPLSVMIVG